MERHEFKRFQAEMKTSVLLGEYGQELVDSLASSKGVPSASRLQIHHNNFRETLAGSLSGIFPTLEAFVGAVFVRGALSEFCVSHPPKDAALVGYGSEFATFLDAHQASDQVPYAPDLVRLEWAIHELQLVDEAALDGTSSKGWKVNPNARFVKSEYPLLSLWSVANGQLPPEAVHLDQGGQNIAVLLLDGEVSMLALTDKEYRWVESSAQEGSSDTVSDSTIASLSKKKVIVAA